MFVQDRNDAREHFFRVWEKQKKNAPLEPMEAIIADVILIHPEYHQYLEKKEFFRDEDFFPEQNRTNPFLHMGMHIALKEQVDSDRPAGIKAIFNKLLGHSPSVHEAEHKMMECLGRALWEAQRNRSLPNEEDYLECLRKIS